MIANYGHKNQKMNITIDFLRKNNLIIFEAITGSRAYGTNLPHSDTDFRGVFILPEEIILGMNYVEQVNDEKNDIVFYELKRFLQLLTLNNPNILELLNAPEDCIVQKTPFFEEILQHRDKFLTKKCKHTFGGYAVEQIKKARGLNKKINVSFEKTRKSPLSFCWVIEENGYSTISLEDFLQKQTIGKGISFQQEYCGLVSLPHFREVYALFYDKEGHLKGEKSAYNGIILGDSSTSVRLSAVEKGKTPIATVYYNKDGYSVYCKEYKDYWEWVEKRNPERFKENVEAGKGYDGKNMLHCHRLLDMAIEIGRGEGIKVRRPNRATLLKIRQGEYEYADLISEAEAKILLMNELYDKSNLADEVDATFADALLVKIRRAFYVKNT